MTASPKLAGIIDEPLPPLSVEVIPLRPRRAHLRFGEIVVLTLLFCFTLEAACRVEDWIQYRTPIFARERSQLDLLIRDTVGMHGRPGGRYQKWSLNAIGMRGPEVSLAKGPNVVRVVTAGASETFGLYESPGREYPRQLEDSLSAVVKELPAACGQLKAEVLNAAMPGMSLPTIDQDIRLRVRPLKPDYVVLYPTPAAYLDDGIPVAARPDSVAREVWGLSPYSALIPRVADRIRNQLKTLLPSPVQDALRRREIRESINRHPPGWRFESVPTDRLQRFDADLRHTIETIRSIGATPILVTHGNRFFAATRSDPAALRLWEKFYPRAAGETIVAFDSVARLATLRAGADTRTAVVDLAPALARTNGAAFADYSHFTDAGASIFAGAVTTSILPIQNRRGALATEWCQTSPRAAVDK